MANEPVGFVGLGTMGRPMAGHVVQKGWPLTVYDLDASRVSELANLGAAAATSPKDVAARSKAVITMLPEGSDVERAALGPGGLVEGFAPGGVLIDMSTIKPSESRRIAEALSKRGIRMLDAPVSRGFKAAWAGTLSIMVGGDKALFETWRPLLAAMGTDIFHVGPPGMGLTVKLINNLLSLSQGALVCEAAALAVKAGVDLEVMLKVVSVSSGDSYSLKDKIPRIIRRDFAPGFKSDLAYKDLSLALAMAGELRMPLPVTAAAREMYAFLRAQGGGGEDPSAIIKVLERAAGLDRS